MMFDFGDEDSENFLFDQPLSVNNGIFLLNHVINETVIDQKIWRYAEKSVSLQCVFHSIRFKVNKRLAVWDR